ncbi:hypothetical protein FRB94_002464, partial [Tulasnella sp. JGI-2019a]
MRLGIQYLGISPPHSSPFWHHHRSSALLLASSLPPLPLPTSPLPQPMHSSSLTSFLALLLLAIFSNARIIGVTAPTNVKAGEGFALILQTAAFIQNFSDEYVIIGAREGTPLCDTCLGTPLSYTNL